MPILLFGLFCLFAVGTPVLASCDAAICPLDTYSALQHEKGLVRLGYEVEYVKQDQPLVGTRPAGPGEFSGHHDEVETTTSIHRLVGTFGLTDRLSLDVGLPYILRNHHHILNQGGAAILEKWDFDGIGDLLVQARFALIRPVDPTLPTFSGLFGMELPMRKRSIVNDNGEAVDPGLTPGSESLDYLIGVTSLQTFTVHTLRGQKAKWPYFMSIYYKINGTGRDGYTLGNVVSANVGTTYPLLTWLGITGQLNLQVRFRDTSGNTAEEVGKTGGEYYFVSPGFIFWLTSGLEVATVLQVPVRQNVNQIQVTSRYNVLTRVSYRFSPRSR